MDYLAAFEISASGMAVEKARLDTVALNLANVNTTRGENGKVYKPLRVISAAKFNDAFDNYLSLSGPGRAAGAQVVEIRELSVTPRLVYEPGHPDADEKGYVAYPNINPASEMVTLVETVRAYEANVRAMNAAKSMALRALEIGGSR